MTVNDFRRHKYFPIQWKKEPMTNGILQVVMELVEELHPDRFPVPTDIQDDLSPTKAALILGETRGYSKVLNTLRILAIPLKTVESVGDPTYAAPLQER